MKIKDVVNEASWKDVAGDAFRNLTGGASIGGVTKNLVKHYGGDENYRASAKAYNNAKNWYGTGQAQPAATTAPASTGAAAPSPTASQLSTQPAQASTLAPGITVVKSNPLTLRYKKHDYLLNKQDVWVLLGPRPQAAPAEMQDFLNSELEKL